MTYLKAVLLFSFAISALAQRKIGNPLDRLPDNIEMLTHFGERADISPDNQQIAFMSKSFGDAFVIDLKTRVIRCLTCNVPGAAFLRIMHLVSGDYILIGPPGFSDIHASRTKENQLWFLSRKPGARPQALDQKMSEGAAISKRGLKISYSVTYAQDAALQPEQSQLFVADVDLSGSTARLTNRRKVYESRSNACRIEAQDFFDEDRKMTFTCYQPHDLASVMTIDLSDGRVEDMSKAPGTYNECEGIYPDGRYTNVEADRQVNTIGGQHGSRNIDIWKLRLDGSGKDFQRLTNFNDYEGYKASNPVVSTDGRFMAFQVAHPADEAGVGYGILVYRFNSPDEKEKDNR
jgi:Tol biopolymer transport system component